MEGVFRPTLNLGNSVIGVGILAMPYCIKMCGVILGLLLLGVSAIFTIWALKMLVRSANMARKATYEQLAFHTFGRHGKLVVELSIIGMALGCLISFFIVIGDLAPPIVAKSLGITWSPTYLRIFLMIFLGLTVSLPLSLLRRVDSLSAVAMGSLLFYSCLLIRVIIMSIPKLGSSEVWGSMSLWRTEGLLHCLPICALALSCHPQMFVIYSQMVDPSVRKMSTIVTGAIWMVSTGYGVMAFFGYINFFHDGVKGDILSNFPHDSLSQFFRFGFSLSVVVSFPLVIFPVRTSIYSLVFSKASGSMELQVAEPIPTKKFNLITVSIIISTLTVAIIVPNVESVLALTGATTGSIISYIFPSLIFLSVVGSHTTFSNRAKFLLVLGVLVMVVGTFTIVNEKMQPTEAPLPVARKYPRPFVIPPEVPKVVGPPVIDEFPKKVPPDPPHPEEVDIVNNDIIDNDVIHDKREGHIPAVNLVGGVEGKDRGGEEGGDGDGGVGNVRGGGEQEEHESIRKDMEELKERIKAVEEENQELKDVLEMKQGEKVNEDSDQRAALPLAAEQKQQDLSDNQPDVNVPQPPEAVDPPQDAVIERRGEEEVMNFDLKQEVEKVSEELLRQDKEVNVIGDERGEEGQEILRKRDLGELPLEEKENPMQDRVEDVGVAGGQDKEEAKEEMRGEDVQDVRGEEVVDDGREQEEARKVRELKAMTDGN